MRRGQPPFMKDRRKTFGVDMGGKRGRAHVRAKGGLLVERDGERRFMYSSGEIMITGRS